jgi:hypothetical protein
VGFLLLVKVQACQLSLEVSAVRNGVLVWKECRISERDVGIITVYVSFLWTVWVIKCEPRIKTSG